MSAPRRAFASRPGATVLALGAAALLAAARPARAVDWSGALTVTSDYIFRGVSQTGGEPALQGSLTASWDPGWYVSGWASNVEFGPDDDASLEIDVLAGWAGDLHGRWTLDAALVRYVYPGERSDDSSEILVSAEWRERLLLAGAVAESGFDVSAGVRFTLRRDWRLELIAARAFLDDFPCSRLEVRAARAWGAWELELAAHVLPDAPRDERLVASLTWSR
jgi:uncharacterized protein (TIGR02001 family)